MSGYVRMGRGGAGNMVPKEEVLKQDHEDLEAQVQTSPKSPVSPANAIAEAKAQSPPPGEYKHMGRGGAGNWYTPSEDEPAPPPAPEEVEVEAEPVTHRQWTGRGGAGNFAPPAAAPAEPREFELKEQAKRVKEEVRQSVDMVLERPGRAHLGAGGRV
ncbi:hypothetical protein EDC01DRAFT_627257 [Geopyxis carbonaria]|nr:hypothetical protein EDC01DRAFT_627257 [Geopyxis carbonaria]